MISTLQAFLIQAAQEASETEVPVSPRLPKFKIRPLDIQEWTHIQKLSTTNDGAQRVSYAGLCKRTCLQACLDPSFKDEEFVKALGCTTPEEALTKTLRAGEIMTLANQIMKFSGFSNSVEEAKEQASDS